MTQRRTASTKSEWYEKISECIIENPEDFYGSFFPDSTLKKAGSSYFLQPCPMCGHSDCCSVKDNSVHCFSMSCGWSGSHIQTWRVYANSVLQLTEGESLKKLEEYFDLFLPSGDIEDEELKKRSIRQQEIRRKAEQFYHEQLLSCSEKFSCKAGIFTPMDYLKVVRKRQDKTISDYKMGFSKNYQELRNGLLELGYTAEEIKGSNVWAPENLFIFFYKHPVTKEILRFNTKNPFSVREVIQTEEGTSQGEVIKGFSQGSKIFYYSPDFSFKRSVLLVEGEHDMFSLYENGMKNIVCYGGKVKDDQVLSLQKCKDFYTFFDNDTAGEEYLTQINKIFPDKMIRKVPFSQDVKDIDEYLCQDTHDSVEELLKASSVIPTENYRIVRPEKGSDTWSIADRFKKVEFIVSGVNNNGVLIGQANLFIEGKLTERQDDVSLVKCKKSMQPFAFFLSDAIHQFFNSDLDKKSYQELASLYWLSNKKQEIICLIAEMIFKDQDHIEEIATNLKKILGDSGVLDKVLIEFNNLKNASLDTARIIPRMKLAQYFSIPNNDGYFYYTCSKDDGDAKRAIPLLLRNNKTTIRLDLLKRKDEQCMLVVDNKYELPYEVPVAVFDPADCSLQDYWVEKYISGEIDQKELDPAKLVESIEKWVRKFFYTNNDNIYKVIALWCFGTYFYTMFGQYPYLYVNGEKGSGKTTLNKALSMFAFNAKAIVDITEAGLFRMASIDGGTLLLDEQETFTSRTSSIQSGYGAILKSGYCAGGNVIRFNTETNKNESFDPFCPKIISNIMGLEDIILDRCIPVNTYRVEASKSTKPEDPNYYIMQDRSSYKEISSKCCLCALENFQRLNKIYKSNYFESENARLSQILTPVLAVARLADGASGEEGHMPGKFEQALNSYFVDTVLSYKKEIEENTPEGILKQIIVTIAKEISGEVPQASIEYLKPENHKYREPIRYNLEEGWFEVNIIHIKVFIEENQPGDIVYPRIIPRWIKTCFNIRSNEIRRKTVNIEDEDLLKEFKNVSKPKVNHYRFYLNDIIKLSISEKAKEIVKKQESDVF